MSFRSWLAGLDAAALTQLLTARPDAAVPPPPTLASLAGRLTVAGSVARAVRRLNAAELAVCEAAAAVGAEHTPVERAALRERAPLPGPAADRAVDSLRAAGLVFGEDAALRILPEVSAALPAGFSPAEEAAAAADPEAVATALDKLPGKAHAVLDTLARTGGVGITREAAADADPARPVPRMLAAGLLVKVDEKTVRMPRIVRDVLRGREHLKIPLTDPLAEAPADPAGAPPAAERAAVGQGLEAARLFDRLVDTLGARPGELIRSGGLAVREAARLCDAAGVGHEDLARLIGAGRAAGLLAVGRPLDLDDDAAFSAPATDDTTGAAARDVLAPTAAADEWAEADLAWRWARLARGWRAATVAGWRWRDGAHLLDEALDEPTLPAVRACVLAPFAALPAGTALPAATATAAAAFTAPLEMLRAEPAATAASLADARFFGVLAEAPEGLVASGLGREIARGADAEATLAAARAATPAPVDKVIVQADMTVTAPGPLVPDVEHRLRRCADVESPGLAAVYRLTAASLRRAFDAGDSAADVHELFDNHTIGQVPQPVRVLVEDVARSHGHLRGGPAGSYLRCDDPDALAAAVELPAAAAVGLRTIAPTVAVSPRPLIEVVEALRGAGMDAVAEDAAGRSVDIRRGPTRVAAPRTARRRGAAADAAGTAHASARAAAIAERLAGADDGGRAGAASASSSPAGAGTDALTALKSAAHSGRSVTVGVVDRGGRSRPHTLRPLRVDGGRVYAVAADGTALSFGLHRVTEVRDGTGETTGC